MIDLNQAEVARNSVMSANGLAFQFDGSDLPVSNGFLVPLDSLGVVVPREGLTPNNIMSITNSLVRKVDGMADPALYFVLVRSEDGNVLFDIARLVDDREQAQNRAVQWEQDSFWDIEENVAVSVLSVTA